MKNTNEDIKFKESFTIDLYLLEGLPDTIHGVTMPGHKPTQYKIGLNADASETQKLATFLHEMTHIYNHDHESHDHVNEIESRTQRQLLEALELLKREAEE